MTTIILIAVAIGLFLLFAKRKKSKPRKATPVQESNPYRSVSVCFDGDACDGVKALADKRFLTSNTPLLPLLDCTSETCSCRYSHYSDRRDFDEDRRLPSSLKSNLFSDSGNSERRVKRGRRTGDWQSKDL